jgi:hypothetical protein
MEGHVFDLRYFDTVGFGNGFDPSIGLLFDGPMSEAIVNPFEGSDIIVSASIMLPYFRVFTELVDQQSSVGRQCDIGITVGAENKSQRSWPYDAYSVYTPDRDPLMPDPLASQPTNGNGGYTVSEVIEVAASGPSIVVDFQDYLNTEPGIGWALYGYRVPVYLESALSHARLHVTIEEKTA